MLALVCLLLTADPPREGKLDARPVGRFVVGDEREQVVTVSRRSAYQVAGVTINQAARYALKSRLVVTALRDDGGATVKQTVSAAELLAADDAVRQSLADALRQTVGTSFDLTVYSSGEAIALNGLKDPLRMKQANGLDGLTLRVGAVLDGDGWRELAGLTLFSPEAGGKPWSRPTTHDWGPLGGWSGRTHFSPKGGAGAERYDFAHALSYRPPRGDGVLPVRLVEPRFEVLAAGGSIRYDAKTARVTAAEEGFRVRGVVTVDLAGQSVRVEVEEEQGFELRVRPPLEGVLKATPPAKR